MKFEMDPDYKKLQAENEASTAKDIAAEHDWQLLKRSEQLAKIKEAIVGFEQEEISKLAASWADKKAFEQVLAMAASPEVVESEFVDGPTAAVLHRVEGAYPGIMSTDEAKLAKREWSAEPWYDDFQEAIRRQVRKDVLLVLESKAGDVGNDIEKVNAYEKLVAAVETGATRSVAAEIEDPALRSEIEQALNAPNGDMVGRAQKLEEDAMRETIADIDRVFEEISAEKKSGTD